MASNYPAGVSDRDFNADVYADEGADTIRQCERCGECYDSENEGTSTDPALCGVCELKQLEEDGKQ